MNFFEQQAQARNASRRMVLLFVLAVIAIVVAIDIVALFAFGGLESREHWQMPTARILLWTSALVLVTIAVSSLFKTASLAAGGPAVARSLGATFVSPDTSNAQHRRLRNVVEEMAIASGVPVPQIFVLEQEPGINAFAAGYSPSDAAVTVTRGALEKLKRDELQGVIGHEFSHVLNGDMRLNIRLMGLLFGIMVLAVIGREVLYFAPRRSARDSKDGGGAILLIALALLVFGYIGLFFGRLIKASVSRKREYLADASAVQFTRQTAGIANALKKAAGLSAGTKLQSVNGEEVAHMLFGDGLGFSGLYATHPPLADRIRHLEPDFDLSQLQSIARVVDDPNYHADEEERPAVADFETTATIPLTAEDVVGQTANPDEEDYRQAARLHRALPESWLAAARDEQRAPQVVMALVVQAEPALRQRQIGMIQANFGAKMRAGVEALLPEAPQLHAVQRLPLASLAMPALRRRPRGDLQTLTQTLDGIINADGLVEPFEYCLGRLLRDQIVEALNPGLRNYGSTKIEDCSDAVVVLYSVMAQAGSDDPAAIRDAFLHGITTALPRAQLGYRPIDNWTAALDRALDVLDKLYPSSKKPLIEGLVAVLSADRVVTIAEAELLRVVCGAIHCPLPLLLQEAQS